MSFTGRKPLSFVSKAYPDEEDVHKFEVESFDGTESISTPYRFTITLVSRDAQIDLKKMMQEPATLVIEGGEKPRFFHGIIKEFQQQRQVKENTFYQAVLVPRLWQVGQHFDNQIFVDEKLPDIIDKVMEQSGLTTQDYELKLKEEYPVWEYISQYRESNLNFLSRWMEREGIYYYFEQGDEQEKMIITDSNMAHVDHPAGAKLTYIDPSGQVPADQDLVTEWSCQQNVLPQKVLLKDYNYRKPSLEVQAEEEVDANGRGNVYVYEEHFKDPAEGQKLATLRAEAHKCGEVVFSGKGTAQHLTPGYLYDLEDHYRFSEKDKNKYLVTEVTHKGSQSGHLSGGRGGAGGGSQSKLGYRNEFKAIPKANDAGDVQYRPEKKAQPTKFYGMMNATVDAAGDGQYAELDDQGRYKVILPYDLSGRKDGKASRFVRMAQSYSGPGFGMHFPLHKGAEVLLTFIDGDLDRPVISSTVPNPENKSPVTDANQSQSAVRTFGGNDIILEDTDGSQQVHIKQTCGNEVILDAAEPKIEIKQECGNEIHMHAAGPDIEIKQQCGNEILMKEAEDIQVRDKYGNEVVLDAASGFIRIKSPTNESIVEIGKSINWTTLSNMFIHAGKDVINKVDGKYLWEVQGDFHKSTVGVTSEEYVGLKQDTFVGGKLSTMLSWTKTFGYGRESKSNYAEKEQKIKKRYYLDSEEAIVLVGGEGNEAQLKLDGDKATIFTKSGALVTLNKSGDIFINNKKAGGKIEIVSKGDIIVKTVKDIYLKAKNVFAKKGKFMTKSIESK